MLDMFLMRKKLGIKHDVSKSELAKFKSIDEIKSNSIEITPSPIDQLYERQIEQTKTWVILALILLIFEDIQDYMYMPGNWYYVRGPYDFITLLMIIRLYFKNSDIRGSIL